MSKRITVREVREALYREGRGQLSSGNGEASTTALGTFLHNACHSLLHSGDSAGLPVALQNADDDPATWPKLIREHLYQHCIGPKLTEHHAALQSSGSQVYSLWIAVGEMSNWLAGLCEVVAKTHDLTPPAAAERFIAEYVTSEVGLECEFHSPKWSEPVILSGIADLIVRIPNKPVACIVELKLGQASLEIDLAQVCLYHQMLNQSENSISANASTSLAIVHFSPECTERVFSEAQLKVSNATLLELVGRLAGVVQQPATVGTPPKELKSLEPEPEIEMPVSKEIQEQAKAIIGLYREFNITINQVGDPIMGPTFIRHRFSPGRGVKVSKVMGHSQEVTMRLALGNQVVISAEGNAVTFDVQRSDRQTVTFEAIEQQLRDGSEFFGSSKFLIGVDLNGEVEQGDFASTENSHLLVAGTTGSGKSEWLRTMMASLIINNTPDSVQFLLIDPKRVAFSDLKGSPYLLRPIVYPGDTDVVEVLNDLVEIMESRYSLFGAAGVDDMKEFVQSTNQALPRIVCIVDEYADLVSQTGKVKKEIESKISRLGFKARAAGIHLVLATQDPRKESVTGTIKGNMTTRIALKTQNAIDSQLCIGEKGAESLLGYGDLFYKAVGSLKRFQAPLLSDERREELFMPQTSETTPEELISVSETEE